jgi:glycerol uptake facilitator protein
MDKRFLGEFMGTAVLVLMGNGVVANVLLRKSKAEGAGWMVIATGWALAVMSGIFTAVACGSADANLNPAVTLASAITSGDFSKLLPYTLAQTLGAMVGATLVWIHFFPHWNLTANLTSEIIATFVLILVASAIASKVGAPNGPAPGLTPYLVGCLIWGIGLSLGGTTGYALNPARDLGPRLMHALLPITQKGDSDWAYAGVPIAGPLIGAGLAGLIVRLVGM